jgi:anti-sigma28 factor (negative regulator of flagellin synthesis)
MLVIAPATGYELNVLRVDGTDMTSSVNGNACSFRMPANAVTVLATFKKTQATLDAEAVAAAKAAIEGATYTVAQATANTSASVRDWLVTQISGLPGMSGTGITVAATHITVSPFSAAATGTAGNPSGTNGSFTFTVSLAKGASNTSTAARTGTITATPYTPPATYPVTVGTVNNGSVTASATSAAAGTAITLTVAPYTGYELTSLTVNGTDVTAYVNGNSYAFTMPAYGVVIEATFARTQASLDAETVAAAKAIIEGETFTVAQSDANTVETVKTWLVAQINGLSGMGATGIAVSDGDIAVSGFSAATAGNSGNPSGTDGSFNFSVSLALGSVSETAGNSGAITAITYTPPPVFAITMTTTSNGSVTPSATSAAAGTVITLTAAPATGYELDAISVYRTGYTGTTVALSGSGNSRTFTMPAYSVTVTATFKKTQAQLDREAVEAAKAAIEGGTYRIAQATGNTDATVKTWLLNTLRVLFGQSSDIQLRSASGAVMDAVVTVKSLTPAIAGTEATPAGTNGSFRYTVTLTRGVATLETVEVAGVIVATPHASTPVKAIELLQLGETAVRILNTGNIATGNLTLTLTGNQAALFTLSTTAPGSLTAGGEADIAFSIQAGLAAGTYRAMLTATTEGMTPVSVEISYTVRPVGISPNLSERGELRACATVGGLLISGLVPGESLTLYNMQGQLVYKGKATAAEERIRLSVRGVYVVVNANRTVKTVY